MVALVGLCRDGGDHAWMVSDLDRPDRHGLGTSESYGNSLGRAAGSCEPGRGLSGVPTDYERVLPMVSSGLAVKQTYRVAEMLSLPIRTTTSQETDSA